MPRERNIRQGEIFIGRIGGDREGMVRIAIKAGRERIIDVEMTPEQFALALFGQGGVGCEFEIRTEKAT